MIIFIEWLVIFLQQERNIARQANIEEVWAIFKGNRTKKKLEVACILLCETNNNKKWYENHMQYAYVD